MRRKLTLEEFIERSIRVHGDAYDYSKSKYIDKDSKILVMHKACNSWIWPRANHHMRGAGCFQCSVKQRIKIKNTEWFISKAILIHSDTFDYSKTKYVDEDTPIFRMHKKCQIWAWQSAISHLKGRGCKHCSGKAKSEKLTKTTEQFIKEAILVHNNKYDYIDVDYINGLISVLIKCNKCLKKFLQTPKDHLSGYGCMDCGGRRQLTTEEFIRRAKEMHGNKYNYDLVDYKAISIRVIIGCNTCFNNFSQLPSNHWGGAGCKRCSGSSISKIESEWLDSIGIEIKCRNITLKINDRNFNVDGFDPKTNTIYEFYGDYWHGNPDIKRTGSYNKICKKSFIELYNKTMEREKVLKDAGYNLITIWENDFIQQSKAII